MYEQSEFKLRFIKLNSICHSCEIIGKSSSQSSYILSLAIAFGLLGSFDALSSVNFSAKIRNIRYLSDHFLCQQNFFFSFYILAQFWQMFHVRFSHVYHNSQFSLYPLRFEFRSAYVSLVHLYLFLLSYSATNRLISAMAD